MTKSIKFFVAASIAFVASNVFAATPVRANTAVSRLDTWWTVRHAEKVAAVADSSVKKDIVFIGDELTQGWETTGAASLASHFTGDKTMFNLGFNGDCTENVLWRIQNGELGSPKAIFLMVGGNNAAIYTEKEEPVGKTYLGVRAIIDYLVANYSSSKIVVQAVLPRGLDDSDPVRPRNDRLNVDVRAYAQKNGCSWVDMSDLFLESDHHTLKTSLFNDDRVTLNASGYEVWAQAVAPYVNAAASGTAMSADLVATARPVVDCIAAFPTATNAVMQDAYWRKFEDDVKLIGENGRNLDLVLLGDSLTQKWMEGNSASSMNGLAANVLNLGRTGDFVENLLWRLKGGCIDGYTTKFFNLLIGTNNTIQKSPSEDPEDIAAGVRAVLDLVLEKHPESKVLLMPIIPYGYTNAQNSAKGAAQYANNQAANEIIRTFADGQRVILVDVRSQFMNADGTYKGEMYLQGNGDYPDMFLHLTTKAYEEILAPAIANAMATAGASSVALPTIGSVAAQVNGTSATVALSDVSKGTDKDGHAASSYTVSYKLDADAEVALSAAETGSSASIQFDELADGWHTCAVWVSSDGVVKSYVKRVRFLIDSQAGAVGWKVAPMDATGSAFRSDGTLVFARGFTGHTVNGVSFSSGFPSADQATVSPSSYSGDGWTENNPVFNGGWVWTKSATSQDIVFTVKGLTAGKKYLVQILAANHWNNSMTTISAGDLVPIEATKQNDYKCGAVITRIFEATGTQEDITINFATSGSKCLVKAIQLRELGDGSGGSSGGEGGEVGGGESGGGESGGGESGGGEIEGEDLTGQFVKKTFTASNKLHLPYRIAAKANPNGGKVPVVVFLHGYGQCGVDNSFSINEISNIKSYLDGAGAPSGYKLIVPQCPNDVKWAEFSMDSTTCTYQEKPSSALVAVFDLIEFYIANSTADPDRIYVTGLSMGGHGTWDAICRRPDFFAAAMPCCGGGDPVCAADIAHVPIWAAHNANDPTIPCAQTESIVTALQALGSGVIFDKFASNDHNAWDRFYSTTDDVTPTAPNRRFVWLFSQNRATNNHQKYPRITEITATPSGSSATISLAGLVLGTDANAVPATKYSIAYKLDGAANTVTALSNQTAEDNSFELADLADGNHTCEVTMTTDKGRTKTKSVVFYVNTSAVSDVWTSSCMDAAGAAFSTEGTFVYGYVCNGGTINGIPFERSVNLQSTENPPKISFEPNIDGFTGDFMNESVGGNLGLAIGNGWYWNSVGSTHTVTLTLSGLEGGKSYLVQFLAHNYWNNTTTVSANGCDPVHIHGDNEASGKYGALITGTFTAMGATKDVTITYTGATGKLPFNAIQVRELDGGGSGGGEATVVAPSIGNVTATTNGTAVSLFLSGIAKGTDDAGVDATSYSVSYTLNGGSAVTALQNQTGATATFDISNLADGNYTCAVTITTDQNKTATKSVNFIIATSSQGGGGGDEPGPTPQAGWTAGPMASDGSTIRTDGTLLYAYSVRGGTVGGVTFTSASDFASAAMVSASPAPEGYVLSDFQNAGVSGSFGQMLESGWYWGYNGAPSGELSFTLTLKGLTSGRTYLVQLVSHRTSGSTLVSVNDSTPVHIHGTHDGVNYTYGGSIVGVFTATGATADFTVTYSAASSSMRPLNAIQVRDLGEGGGGGSDPVDPVDPVETPVYTLTIPAKTGLTLGTVTTNGVAVAVANNACSIVSNTTVTINFTAASGYEIVSGNPVVLTVTANKTLAAGEYPVVQEQGGGGSGGDDPIVPVADGWTAVAMGPTSASICTTGTLVYAYARGNYTVNGVAFTGVGDSIINNADCVVWEASTGALPAGSTAPSGTESGAYKDLLEHSWYAYEKGRKIKLNNLEGGKKYLVQIIASRSDFTTQSATAPDGVTTIKFGGQDWECGGSLVGIFTASGTSAEFTIQYVGNACINAIQVRDLSSGGGSGGGGSGGGASYEIIAGPDTTNTLSLAKIAEYDFPSNGCGAITYSGQGGIFYVLQDHDDDGYAKIHPLSLGIDPSTGAILSQNLGATFTPAGLRDAEGLALDPLSGTLWASSEWTPPSITEFGIDGAATSRTAPVPAIQLSKLRSNLSLESLTISPDGLTMWTANEQALTCDGESSSGNTNVATVVRLTRFTRETAQDNWQAAGEWAYACDPCAGTTSSQSGLSGLCALPDGSLLALEREVSTTTCGRCRIYRITTGALAVATDVSSISALTNVTYTAVAKGDCLISFNGPSPNSIFGPYNLIVYEGIALGPKLNDGSRAVYLVSDGGTSTSRTAMGITVTANTVSRICALKLIGLPDDGEPAVIQDWPANPDTAITDATRPSDLGIVAGAFASSGTTTAELRKLSRWARAHNVPYAGAGVNAMTFDANGNPGTLHATAYLLNCAVAEVEESSAAFKFTAITPGTVPTIEGNFNGRVTVYGADELAGPWQIATEQHHFFKATLTR